MKMKQTYIPSIWLHVLLFLFFSFLFNIFIIDNLFLLLECVRANGSYFTTGSLGVITLCGSGDK